MHIDAHRCQSSFIFHRQACNSVHISTLSTTRALLLFHCQMMLRPASKHTNFVWVSRLIFSVTHTETFCETYKYTRTHTHASSQWWITCNGLPQILLCPCIKCQNRSNVMSLSNCSLSRSLWLTLLHTDRTKVDFTTDWLWVGGVSMCMHTHTFTLSTARGRRFLYNDFFLHSLHTDGAIRQKAKVMTNLESAAWGRAGTAHQHQNIFYSCSNVSPRFICVEPLKPR